MNDVQKAAVLQQLEGLEGEAFNARLRELAQDTATPDATADRGRPLADVLGEAFDHMDARGEKREKPIVTPWADFNEQLPGGGFWPGCHVLVSGTGAGKSTWALQLALHAARNGTAVAYAGLELEDTQIALRLAGELAKVGWSNLYTGESSIDDRAKARAVQSELAALPFYLESGDAMGWAASSMQTAAARLRKEHPAAPILIVVDFLQLVGPEPNMGRQDLRERIGRAAYMARDVARRFGACVLLVSSVAREAYAKVNGTDALELAGLDAEMDGSIVLERFMRSPDSIVGLGKESGEIEYAADSVTVAVGLPRKRGDTHRAVVFATPKLRAGRPGWCALHFNGHRFDVDPYHGALVIDALQKAKSDAASSSGKREAKQPGGNGSSSKARPSSYSDGDRE